ncbi:MAG: tetratricopeptide repeat protein [Desulfuromonas sp.]|nr:tetratricopeptide repeat protein [Desulfuromonas sp.]
MIIESYAELMKKGLKALEQHSSVEALMLFQQADSQQSTAISRSYLAYCLSKVKHQHQRAISLCQSALRDEPHNADHYLNLGRIYLLAGKRGQAMHIFRRGIKLGPNAALLAELKKFDRRQSPVFSSLERTNILNRYAGRIMSFIGLR